jgi:hypothetical protein
VTHFDSADLGPHRKLTKGDEAEVRFNGSKRRTRARFHHADQHGNLTFIDPSRSAMRTVTPDQVGTIHRVRRAET